VVLRNLPRNPQRNPVKKCLVVLRNPAKNLARNLQRNLARNPRRNLARNPARNIKLKLIYNLL
jgi:hypothetical protein